jgi:hypothetical protein
MLSHVFTHVFLLSFSVVCRPPYPLSGTAWQFCRDPWTSHVVPRVSPRISPSVSLIFLRGLPSSLSPFSNCLAILLGSLGLTCCHTCFSYLSSWSVVFLFSLLKLPGCCPSCFSYLSPWSVVLLITLLKLPGYFAVILLPHVFPHLF